MEGSVAEVAIEKSQLPHLIGDVFAYVGYGAVRSNDDFLVLLCALFLFVLVPEIHHPTAIVLAGGREPDRLFLLEKRIGALPEAQLQNGALRRQQVVLDIDACHGLEMTAYDGLGDDCSQGPFGGLVLLDGLQRVLTKMDALAILRIELRHAGVDIPAKVVETLFRDQRGHFFGRHVLEVQESHQDVRDLDSGIVDIVLHFHVRTRVAKRPNECVAEGGVTEVADVSGFVGVDVGMLDDDLLGHAARFRG